MITTSQTFYDNSIFKYRSTKSQVSLYVFDLTAKDDIDEVTVNAYKYFYENQMYDNNDYNEHYGTLERNEFFLDGNMAMFPDTITNEQIGWWTPLSDANGDFTTNPEIIYKLNNLHSTAGITCFFDGISYPLKVKCQWFCGNLLLESMEIEPESNVVTFFKGVNNYDKVLIEIGKAKPYSYVKMSTIDFGIVQTFTAAELQGIKVKEITSIMSNTLSPNELEFSIFNYDYYYNVFDPTNLFKYFKVGQKCIVKSAVMNIYSNEYEWIPMGAYYVSSATVDSGMLKIKAYGILDVLNTQYFYSPFYNNETVENIVGDILEGYDHYVNPNVKDITLSGYIPLGTKKEALKYVAIASNSVVKEGREGAIYFFQATEELSTNQIITEDTIFTGYGMSGLMQTNVMPLPYVNVPVPYVFTADRDTRLSQIKTDMIGVYNQCDVIYKTYTSGASETLYNETITTDENGYVLIQYDSPVNVTGATGGGTFSHYADCSVMLGTPNTQYTVTITGNKYTVVDSVASSYMDNEDSAYDDAKLTMTLKDANTLITSQARAKSCATWYLSQLMKRKDVSFDWWSVATVEASDYIKVETSDGTIATMQINEINYNLLDLIATVKGVM